MVWGFFFWYGYDYNILTNFGLPKVFMLLLMVTKVRYGNLMAPDHLEMISAECPALTRQYLFSCPDSSYLLKGLVTRGLSPIITVPLTPNHCSLCPVVTVHHRTVSGSAASSKLLKK